MQINAVTLRNACYNRAIVPFVVFIILFFMGLWNQKESSAVKLGFVVAQWHVDLWSVLWFVL